MADNEELLDEEDGGDYNIVAIVITMVVAIVLIGGGVWYFFFRTPSETTEEKTTQLPQWEAPETADKELVFDMLPAMVINPLDSNGRYYLQVKVDFTFNRDMNSELIGKPWLLPQAKNIIIDIFSDFTVEELQTSEFREEARNEIKTEFNRLLGWTEDKAAPQTEGETDPETLPPIKEVYLVQFILQ